MKTPTTLRQTLRAGLLAAATAAILGGAAIAPALADDHDWHRGNTGHSEQAWRDHDHDHDRHGPPVYAYGYAYPPGYGYRYAPAPAYAVPPLNFGVTIR